MLPVEIGKVYRFNTNAPAVLGASIQNAKLLSIVIYDEAIKDDNIDLMYRNIYPNLPDGTPRDPSSCLYYRFKSESGEKITLAEWWIIESTIEVIENVRFRVHVENSSLIEMGRVRDALNALGIREYNIQQL